MSSIRSDLPFVTRLCETVHRLAEGARDEALGELVRTALASPHGGLVSSPPSDAGGLSAEIAAGEQRYGWFAVAGRDGGYGPLETARLGEIARLTGTLLAARDAWTRQAVGDAEAKLRQQGQILDQIHDSVITMDPFGFITGWNKGAERLFGYAADEAVGRNILFLYADEGESPDYPLFPDEFRDHGGHEMEVRRRKKSGDIFWASLSLSRSYDGEGRVIGLTGFLTDITERKHAEERVHSLAYYDPLTGLPNRTLLIDLTDKALARAARHRQQLALLFIDLNRFKPINDTLGHEIGNCLLQAVGQRFCEAVRGGDVVARLSGDEFVVALFELARREHAAIVAEKLLTVLDAPFFIREHELRVGGSIGISVFPDDGNDTETLLRLADVAMYRTKRTQLDGFAFYSRDMNRRALDALRIETGLRRALQHGELRVHYQPKVALSDGRIIGVEALVRWQHPEDGLVAPNDFVPIAEETGLVVRLGAFVFEAACAQAAAWRDAGFQPIRVAVNVSAREFVPTLPGRVRAELARHRLTPDWLELEITESTLMHSPERVITMMDELTQMGVALSLDDFGTGYSSLSYLKRFPIDTLKIDRSFIHGIPEDPSDNAIAGAIIGMAKRLGHRVIAEGVENRAQLTFLEAAGCDEIQGFLFSPPVEAGEMTSLLAAGPIPRP